MQDFEGLVCTHWGHWSELEMQRIGRPALAAGQVRIRVHHAGVGFAVSLFVSGKYQRKPPLPFTPGTEVSGEILEVAPDVTRLHVGQRVVAALDWGGFAEEAVATADTVYPVPDGLALRHAAALPITYGTVWSALEWRANLRAGDTLLVHGASGSLGMAAVQIGRLMGARVIATASTEAKRQAALQNGAAHAIPSDPAELAQAVKRLCPGGVDVVFDPVGGALFDLSLRVTAWEGRIVVVGFASGEIPQIPANLLLVKNIAALGFFWGSYRKHDPGRLRESFEQLFTWLDEGRIRPYVAQVLPLAQGQDALALLKERRSTGKVVVQVAAPPPKPGYRTAPPKLRGQVRRRR